MSGPVEPIDNASAVRFETHCVVIPDLKSSRRPRVVTKSYTLPLWKRRTSSTGNLPSVPPEDDSFDEQQSHLVLRFPLPTISLKPQSTRSADLSPLPPCLVNRPQPTATNPSPSSPTHTRHSPNRRRKPSPSPSRPDGNLITVPLRPCCAACHPVTEAALVDGDAWPEQFSRAASRQRQRSLSADGGARTLTVAGSAAAASYGSLGVSISVDEIDKRRRASDTGPPASRDCDREQDGDGEEDYKAPVIHCRHAPSASESSLSRGHAPTTPRIPEEEDDEDENVLFPLPSPKRTPTTSPAPSLAGSMSSLTVAQQASQRSQNSASPVASMCSGESGVLPQPHPSKRHLLVPQTCSSSSSLSLPKLSESVTDLNSGLDLGFMSEDPPRVPSPSLLSGLPSLSGRHSLPCVSTLPSDTETTDAEGTLSSMQTPRTGAFPTSAPAPTQTNASLSAPIPTLSNRSPILPSSSPRLPWRTKRSASNDIRSSQSSSPTAPTPALTISTHTHTPSSASSPSSSRRFSISISTPLQVFADVFRGVGATSSPGLSM